MKLYDLRGKRSYRVLTILLMALMLLGLATACLAPAAEEASPATPTMSGDDMTDMTDMNNNEDVSGMDMTGDADHADDEAFVPNNGAVVHITAPADGAIFKSSDSILVTIETTNFTIGENGNHWHIYLDGNPIMVMGGNTFVLQNLSAGGHDIAVYLSNGQHENLEDGDKVSITVEE
ncbi:MAG: hypothetical protein H6667_09015 [Ardenticatenaceae bacterium]|nr:hypothetical protein [Ardenticatenaceae bacterium]MCB9445213.1 hypothetical protein [Ardenticatenaceae bacterium]